MPLKPHQAFLDEATLQALEDGDHQQAERVLQHLYAFCAGVTGVNWGFCMGLTGAYVVLRWALQQFTIQGCRLYRGLWGFTAVYKVYKVVQKGL